jgi:F-type H+-transporting ATPase subunit beta
MNKQETFPFSEALLGRVVNSRGEPVDSKGALPNAHSISLDIKTTRQADSRVKQLLFEIGIKAVDLLAPLLRGGVTMLIGDERAGKMALVEETMQRVASRRNGYTVYACMDDVSYEMTQPAELVKEGDLGNTTAVLYERLAGDDAAGRARKLLRAALAVAGQLRAQGRSVLLVADLHQGIQASELLNEFRRSVQDLYVPAYWINYEDAPVDTVEWQGFDGCIVFIKMLAQQNIWPAIDPIRSTSRLLRSVATSVIHQQIAQQVRNLLQNLHSSTTPESNERARRLQRFLSQPFFVAEAFSGVPGEYVPLNETLYSIQELLDGHYDDLPEEAFALAGSIEQVVVKSQKHHNSASDL